MAHAFTNRPNAASDNHSYVGRPYARDSRNDLGYGILEPKFHISRKQSSNFPYLDDDIELPEEEVIDAEDVDKFLSKSGLGYAKKDFGAKYGTDPFYFAAGNTKLSDCFFRPDEVLKEVEMMSRNLSSTKPTLRRGPGVTKKRGPSDQSGASFPHGVGNFRPTGSKKGYAGQIPDIVSDTLDDEISNINVYSLYDILDDEQQSLKKTHDVHMNINNLNRNSEEI